MFVSTATQGGGQENTCATMMSTFAHHGIIFVPLGYKTVFGQMSGNDEVRGGSAWGAGTFAVRTNGRGFAKITANLCAGW